MQTPAGSEFTAGHARAAKVPLLSRDVMLLLLTLAAGSMDAISYLGLEHVFTAMMTGNTVLLGLALGQGHILPAFRSMLALLGFAAGAILGAMIVQRGERQSDWPPAVTRALTVEWILLGIFTVLWHVTGPDRAELWLSLLILLAALAMGVQSAAVHRLGVPGIMTTYITGTLTNLMVDIAHLSRPVLGVVTRERARVQWERRVGLMAAVFVVYGLGAVTGSFLEFRSFGFATFVPFLAVGLVVGSAVARQRRLA